MKLTLHYNSGIETVRLKYAWDQLSFGEFQQLLKNARITDDWERIVANISVLTGLQREQIAGFDYEVINGITPYLSFIDQVDNLNFSGVPAKLAKVNIGLESWGKLEAVKQLIANHDELNLMMITPDIVKVYCPKVDISKMSFMEGYSIACFFLSELNTFFSKYTRLNDFEPSAEQKQAGIDQLSQYGFFTTLHALAKGSPLEYDRMLEQPADNIYQTLVVDFELSEYQKRFHNAMMSATK